MEQKIELRSERVRSIIGKMPSILIRYGTGIIAAVLFFVVAGSFFFKFTPVYYTHAQVSISKNDTIIRIEVPVGLEPLVKVGTGSVIFFDNISGFDTERLHVTVNYIDTVMYINDSGVFFHVFCEVNNFDFVDKNIETDGFISAKAQISDVEISLLNYVVGKAFRTSAHKNI
ncbi:MAG: hypothetical protein LBH91_07780 [Prevotellaceae bacterium]|nr:hypothetical protein [Prevotellaceae bacterium]